MNIKVNITSSQDNNENHDILILSLCVASIPIVVRLTVIKAKTRPGIEATLCAVFMSTSYNLIFGPIFYENNRIFL